jgi:transposase-like protein
MTNSKFRSKITIAQQEAMRELFKTGYGISYIARRFKCWPNTVWNHVYDLSPPRKISAKEKNQYTKNSSLTDKDVIQIRRLALQGMKSPQIKKLYNISQSAALGIVNGKSYRWVEGPTRKGFLKPLVMNRVKRTTNLHPGAKPGSKQSVPSGSLKTLAKKYGVAPCTIRRWVLKGKINVLPI